MKRKALFFVVLISGCTLSCRVMAQIIEVPFHIAGGRVLQLPVTDGGPIPAEKNGIKIQVAGFVIGPSASNPAVPALTWRFAFSAKTDQQLEQVVVEEVGTSDSAKLMLSDNQPQLEKGSWVGGSETIKADPSTTPWLYSNAPSIFVFKFSIKAQGMPVQILYQPSWFSAQAKKAMISGYAKGAD
jgi:hypothetical protein